MGDDIIRGYKILQPFRMVGGGRCQWTFATKGGKQYFIKQYLAPRYPVEGSPGSEKTKALKRAECEKFSSHHNRITETIKSRVAVGGNLIYTTDFFREGTYFYKVTEKVDITTLSPKDVAALPLNQRLMILLTILSSIKVLHACNIVHGDLKPDNILLKKGMRDDYIAKLIDFDDSYFANEAPDITEEDETEEIVGTIDYYSPELGSYVKQDGTVKASDLSLSSDIFALGVIFCEYITGKKPLFDTKKYRYAWESALDGKPPVIESLASSKKTGDAIDFAALAKVINQMMVRDAALRPNAETVMNHIKAVRNGTSATMPLPIIDIPKSDPAKPEAKRTGGGIFAKGFGKKPEEKVEVKVPKIPTTSDTPSGEKSRLILGPGFSKKPGSDDSKK
jgi:eukaryotic-like serine/threonine-protein kinase